MTALKVFMHNDMPYVKIIPCKRLFNSTTIHEVVTRGDIFALNLLTTQFTVLPNGADKWNQESFLQSTISSSKAKK